MLDKLVVEMVQQNSSWLLWGVMSTICPKWHMHLPLLVGLRPVPQVDKKSDRPTQTPRTSKAKEHDSYVTIVSYAFIWCVLQAQQHLVWETRFSRLFFWGIGVHHGFQARMGNQPTCSHEIGSPFVIKAGSAVAFAPGIKNLFLWKCPIFQSNNLVGKWQAAWPN